MNQQEPSRPEERGDRLSYFFIAVIVCTAIWLATPWIIERFDNNPDHRGTTGDMFGAVNALFSGFAFAGVIYAIYLQRNELALQREEMRRATQEHANQTHLMQKQIDSLRKSEDFDKYVRFLDSEPKLFVDRITQHSNNSTIYIINVGKPIYNIEYTGHMQEQAMAANKEFKFLNTKGCFHISIPRTESTHLFILKISYQNELMYYITRILEIDLRDQSIIETYNSFLEKLEIPEFYKRNCLDSDK